MLIYSNNNNNIQPIVYGIKIYGNTLAPGLAIILESSGGFRNLPNGSTIPEIRALGDLKSAVSFLSESGPRLPANPGHFEKIWGISSVKPVYLHLKYSFNYP